MYKKILFIALAILSLTAHSFVDDKEKEEECGTMSSSLTSNENNLKAAIFYSMDQMPTSKADTIIDATSNTFGKVNNTTGELPQLIQGAAVHSLTSWDFSQTEEYIRIPSNATTKRLGDLSKTDGLTIGFWMNYDHIPEYGNRYIAGLANTFDIMISAEKIHVRYLETYVDAIASSSSDGIMNNGWQHIAVSLDFTQTTNNLNLYLNGNLITTESYPITSSFNSMSHLNIGARSNNGNPYPGKVDDFIIFDEATSSTDVMKLYEKGAHHFIDPDDYSYGAASQPGGYSYAWDNYTKDEFTGFGERQVNFDYTGVNTISHAPPVGVHPRLFFSPHDIPEMKNRLQNTESGIAVMKYIHAFTTLLHIDFTTWTGESGYDVNADYAIDKDGNRLVGNVGHADTKIYYDRLIANDPTFYDDPDFSFTRRVSLSSQMAMEAFECLIHEGEFDSDTGKSYNDRAMDLAKAVTFWSSMIVDDPSILTQGLIFHYFHPVDMSLVYDLNYRVMTESQRSVVRQALALTLPEHNKIYGYGMSCYSTTSNFAPLLGYQILANLVIEGEEGYDPALTHSWLRSMYNFMTYGWNASGAGYEGLGKNYQFSTHLIAFAKRGYSLLGHPHVKSYGEDFLLGIMQPFGHAFSCNDSWGGSGPDDVTGGYKFNTTDAIGLKWIFKDSPKVDFVWRNYMQKLRNSDSYDYVYGNIGTNFGQTNVIVPAAIFAIKTKTSILTLQKYKRQTTLHLTEACR